MALTELQMPTKASLYQNLKALATETRRFMERIEIASDWIGFVTIADLDTMGITDAQVRTDLVDFKQVLIELVNLFEGSAVTPAKNQKGVVDKLREMLVV